MSSFSESLSKKHSQAQELEHSFHLAVLFWEGELSKGWWVPGRSGLLGGP